MSTPPPVKRLALPNALRQRELEAGLGGNRRGPSALGNVPRSPEVYVPTARNLLQRYPIPEPVDPRTLSPFPWKKGAAPWLAKMQENENYAKLPQLTKRPRNQLTNNQSAANNTVRRKINVNSNKPNKPNNANTRKSKKARRTRKN